MEDCGSNWLRGQGQLERVAHLLRDKTIQRSNLRENAHLADGTVNQYGVRKTGWDAHACDVMYDAVDDLALERLKHNSAISRDELCLAVPGNDHALADVGYGDDGDYEAELA